MVAFRAMEHQQRPACAHHSTDAVAIDLSIFARIIAGWNRGGKLSTIS
jgi:hypothetical protein